MGAWRRQGRVRVANRPGLILSAGAVAAAALVFVLAGAFVWMSAAMANLNAAAMLAYPPAAVIGLRLAALAVVAAAIAGLVSLWFAWASAGWRLLRKLHHTAFALALAFLALMLVLWNVVFAATA
jgi:hypothetical protein